MKIDKFAGSYEFLSNFFPANTEFEGVVYPTSEHAFQAAKTLDPNERERVRLASTPSSAKALGKKVTLRKDWNFLRTAYMKQVLESKFQDPELRRRLLETGDAELIEGNTWGDTFWGVSRGSGQNRLGKILMELRSQYRNNCSVVDP